MLLSAIVVNFRQPELLRACLRSLDAALERVEGEAEPSWSRTGRATARRSSFAASTPGGSGRADENRGFGGGVNAGLERSRGEYVALVNNDATVEPDALAELVRVACEGGRDVARWPLRCASQLGRRRSTPRHRDRSAGIVYDRLLGAAAGSGERCPLEVFGPSGGGALWRRAALDSIGGFDGSFFVYLEDADLAWRARMRGWRSLYAPAAVVYHHHSATAVHASPFKYSWVGRHRVRLLARNADARMLARHAPAMVAYVAYAAGRGRTLAPVTGRLRGLREWRSARRSGAAGRRRVELKPPRGLAAALARRRAWSAESMPRSTRSRF